MMSLGGRKCATLWAAQHHSAVRNVSLCGQCRESCDVLAEDVELNVYGGAYGYVAEVGVVVGVGYYRHTEGVGRGIAHG